MNILTDQQVRKTLEPVLNKLLKNLNLKKFVTLSDTNYDGDQIIRVYTVLGKEIDGKTYSQAISEVNAALREKGEGRFAHISIGLPENYVLKDKQIAG